MAIINRSLSKSTKRQTFTLVKSTATATGVTTVITQIPFIGLVQSFYCAAIGISNTPTASLNLYRFNATGGFTSIVVGATLTLPEFGTSGAVSSGFTALSAGVTCLQGDLLVALSGGANSAAALVTYSGVIEPTQDILSYPGL